MTSTQHTKTQRTQLTLPGQSHTAEGRHDHAGMYVMHFAFRRDLAAFASSVRATPLGDQATWQALGARWARFADTLHHHHRAEDTLYWPVLLAAVESRGTEADRAEVRAMSDEHADIDPLVRACAQGFADVVEHPEGADDDAGEEQPAQVEVGRLWQAGLITIAQEHFISAVTQTCLALVATPNDRVSGRATSRLVASAVGSEGHDLGLRMLCELLQNEGWETEFLGAGVPGPDLVAFVATVRPEVVALSVTLPAGLAPARETIALLRDFAHAWDAYRGDPTSATRGAGDVAAYRGRAALFA